MTNWKDVWKEAIGAARGKLEARAPEAQSHLGDIADAHKKSLRALLSAFEDGKIDEQTLDSELVDERLVFERELLALQSVTKRAGREAANAFFDAIEEAAGRS
jgi:hypothetical protein